ncbi:MAG TPA: hypothetical protein VNX68_07680 [Nitrosopumilaceae archaeon]|nr:hypothetical protein [Nitrosopumilaceae archaeon]
MNTPSPMRQKVYTLKVAILTVILLILVSALMTGCANVSHIKECLPEAEHTYGFFGGLWHGLVAPLSFFGELFSDNIAVYAHNNNGAWYDFGFLIGVGAFAKSVTYTKSN